MTGGGEDAVAGLLLLREVEAFLVREAGLLDDRRFEDWIALFADDGYYWAPAEPGQENPLAGVSLFFDDVAMLRTRIARLRHPRAHAQVPPSRTSRLVSNVAVEGRNPARGAVEASARFVLLEFRPGHAQRVFGGRYDYALLREGEGAFRIAAKKATILNCDDAHFPISVPF